MVKKITEDMLIGKIAIDFPDAIEVMEQFGMHCIGCHVAPNESLKDGALTHNIDPQKLVDAINKKLELADNSEQST